MINILQSNDRTYERGTVKDIKPIIAHPKGYGWTFWYGFCLLGGYKFILGTIILILYFAFW